MWRSSCEQYRSRPARRPRPCDEQRFSRHELRRAKPVEVVAADGERLLAPLEVDLRGLVVVPADVADGAEIDDDGAMHLRELVGIELAEELLQRRADHGRSEEHTSELQSPMYLVCRLLLEKKKTNR